MNIKGKITNVLEPLKGQSQKGEWCKQDFVIETDGDYKKKICFTVWNENAVIPEVGQEANIHFNAESREYKGRWFTNLTAWKIELESNVVKEKTIEPSDDFEKKNEDGLPF